MLEADGIEGVLADPDRVVTLVPAFEHATVAFVLLGSAAGAPEAVRALARARTEGEAGPLEMRSPVKRRWSVWGLKESLERRWTTKRG